MSVPVGPSKLCHIIGGPDSPGLADSFDILLIQGSGPAHKYGKADKMAQPCCMIVEDQVLIGMALEASLQDAGFDIVGPFLNNEQALQWLESDVPDIAVLDIMLKDGTSLQVARELKNRGVPFAVYSGLPQRNDCPPELQDVPWLEKPARRETLAAILERLAKAGAVGSGQARIHEELQP